MKKKKIFNDPLYGLIGFDHEIIYKLIDHPYFQRLRRIKQMGLSDYIYPGAVHTRFQHSLGALYLMKKSIESLKWKGVDISDEEYKAVSIAILLHDIGHGPFSHALERVFISISHEEITLRIMEKLNIEFEGELSLAIDIFKGKYFRKFFKQLISGQLDVDRLDYLTRDSFFTGVAEGVIGYDRIITMLNVVDDRLVVEEKAIYSIEKFLVARKIMYWQVYLHKTSLSAENMIYHLFDYIINEAKDDDRKLLPESLQKLISVDKLEMRMKYFMELDDSDILYAIKSLMDSDNLFVSFMSKGLIERRLLKIILKNVKINSDYLKSLRLNVEKRYGFEKNVLKRLMFTGEVSNEAYSEKQDEIEFLLKSGDTIKLSEYTPITSYSSKSVKYFVLYPEYA